MPVQKPTENVLKRFGNRLNAALAEANNAPVEYGPMRPPPGINRGIAKLVACGFGEYKSGNYKDQPYFRAAGVIIEPKSVIVDGREVQCAGLQTSIMIPVCDTENSDGKVVAAAEHLTSENVNVVNEMRKLGGDDFTASTKTAADLVPLAAALEEAGPYFYFSTSLRRGREFIDPKTKEKRKSEDGVWENWHGGKGLEDYAPPEGAGVQDASGAAGFNPDDADGGASAGDIADDLEELQAQAEAMDEDAIVRLKELAMAAGHDEEEVDGADSWADVVAMISSGPGNGRPAPSTNGASSDNGADEPATAPEKGQIYKVKRQVQDPRTKKTVSRLVDVEIVAVNGKNGTVTVKEVATGKIVADAKKKPVPVPFTDLVSE